MIRRGRVRVCLAPCCSDRPDSVHIKESEMMVSKTSNMVFKYPLPAIGAFTLFLPSKSTLLHVGVQKNEPFLWVAVNADPQAAHETVNLVAALTGSPDDRLGSTTYVGTVLLDEGEYVVHYFRTDPDSPL